ncbi:TasA family protein [Evansella cellulosilytica]|uniref:Spore coat-associated protein n=1 Tax=Evansella cellulosilytica (strain ATCC 21833 / DSM 2522 / FERM P-1141 / JCM 9156 / N-4) TaxID=649639 RepID=E6TV05_EVAC2|nr:TasA family protein [Evansella cellulosilytica]ADU28588.1 spore coat-associated protein [Evansella cellulosilytica DSM 2522]
MSIKKKLSMGVLTAALGLALIGGGTFAYFSDTATQTNTFASGTIDLDVDPEVQVAMYNLKPGDWMPRSFELQNNGSLDIKYVDLNTEYSVTDSDGDAVVPGLADEYAKQLIVQFLNNTTGDEDYEVLFEVSLYDLANLTPEDLATKIDVDTVMTHPGIWIPVFGGGFWLKQPQYEDISEEITGIAAGDTADFDVQFRFNDTGERQNDLQGLNLELTWTFEGFQTDGEER